MSPELDVPPILAVYGTLRLGGRLHHLLGINRGRADLFARATIAGAIFEVGADTRDRSVDCTYPCFIASGAGRVVVDLVALHDPDLLGELDRVEGYDPNGRTVNEYVRRPILLHNVEMSTPTETARHAVSVLTAPGTAWVYEYVRHAIDPTRRIRDGDWIAHGTTDQPTGSSYR